MADAQSNIQVNIDTTQALASIKNLQRQIAAFHTSMAKGGAAANAVSAQMQQTLINSINSTGKFSAQIKTIKTTTESFTTSLERNKFSLGEYFRYAGGASKTFGRLFKTEFDTINKVARENVKDLQTQYIKMGRDASGAMKAIAVRPLSLDMQDLATKTMIASEKQAILNQLLKQGSTNLLNFGKNTQWAGRQLMVGFTLPLIALGSAASKTFMDMETQAIRFKKVYGDLFTPNAESAQALKDIQDLGKEFTKYGIAVADTVGLAAEAAAAGFQGVDLQRQTAAATKLSILGQVESQKALETTISLQNAFSMSSENLAESIDFLNAVENQTVLSLDDMSTAIPKAAPVVQQLGGDVKDLAFLMTAMKEGGINASEGANALKSGLASLINPTGKANEMLLAFGINAKEIVLQNKGDLKKTVIEFATALNKLDPLNRAQAIEQMFGKFQFARLSTLFANVTKEGTQASRVLDLAGSSIQELAALSEKELGMTSASAMNKFKGAVENLKLSLVPVGEEFLKAVTPIAEFLTRVLDKFNNLSDNTKKIIVTITAVVAGLGPVFLMTFGLLANGLANIIKGFTFLKTLFNKTGQSTATLGTEVRYMTTEQRNAAAVAASLDQVHVKLAQTFTSEASAVNALTRAYQRAIVAQSQFVPVAPPITRGPIKKFATGKPAQVGGTGNKDSELALLMPGETVIPTAMSEKYGSLINAMIDDKVPGYQYGKPTSGNKSLYGGQERILGPYTMFAPGNLPGGFGMDEAFLFADDFTRSLANTATTTAAIEGKIRLTDTAISELLKFGTPYAEEITGELRLAAKELSDTGKSATHISQLFGKKEKEIKTILSRMSTTGPTGVAMARGLQIFAYPTDQDILTGGNVRVPGVDVDEKGNVVRAAPRTDRSGKADAFQRRIARVTKRNPLSTQARVTRAHVLPEQRVLAGGIRPLGGGVLGLPIQTQLAARAELEKRHLKLSQELGIKDIKAYDSGVKSVKIEDPYKLSQDRKSPHREAAQDGKDDARAYVTARDKELAKASKQPRLATKGQGPAPIGATPLPGMTVLPIVPKDGSQTTDPNNPPRNNIFTNNPATNIPPAGKKTILQTLLGLGKKAGGKVTGMGGGFGLLGLNMGLSMTPDFAGKGVAQSTLTGANLGMFLGPKGTAVGAGIGFASGSLSALNAKIKEYGEVNKSAFTISNSLITAFGDKVLDTSIKVTELKASSIGLADTFNLMSPAVQAIVDDLKSLPEDDPLAIFIKKISTQGQSLQGVIGNLRSRVATDIALGGLDPKNAEKFVFALLSAAGKANYFGEVWKSISKDVIDGSTATTASFNKLGDAVSKAGGEFIFLGSRGTLTKYEDLRDTAKQLSDQMFSFFGIMTNGSFTFDQIQKRLKALDASSLDAKTSILALRAAVMASGDPKLIERFKLIEKMFLDSGEAARLTAADYVMAQLALEMIGSDGKNLDSIYEELFSDEGERALARRFATPFQLLEKLQEGTKFKDFINNLNKSRQALADSFDPDTYQEYNDGTDKAKTTTELYIDVLEKEINELEAKRDAQKDANDETQRQIDLQMKLKDLARESVLAKISGDYIKAANLQQEAQNVQMEFDQETELRKKDAEIARLKARVQELRDGANPTKSEIAKIPKDKLAALKKDPKAKSNASGGMIRGAGTGTSDSIPAYLSNGEYVIKADSVKKYGVGTFDALNTQRFKDGGLASRPKYGTRLGSNKLNIPLSAGSTASMYSPATGLSSDPKFQLDAKESAAFSSQLENMFNFAITPTKNMFNLLMKPLTPSAAPDINKQSEYSQRLREAAEKAINTMHHVYAPSRIGTYLVQPNMDALLNIGAGDAKWNDYTTIASNFLGLGLIKPGASAIGRGIGRVGSGIKEKFSGLSYSSKKAKLRKQFEDIKAEDKLLTPEGDEARIALSHYEALMAARTKKFTPLMDFKSTSAEKLIAENQAMPSLIEETLQVNGKDFTFRFTKYPLTQSDTRSIDYFLDDIKRSTDPRPLKRSEHVVGDHLVEIIDPLTGTRAAYIRYDALTGAIGYRGTEPAYQKRGLSELLYNKAAEITRIRHSWNLTTQGRASAPKIGGFMSDDPIYSLPGLSSLPGTPTLPGIPSLKTAVKKVIKKSKKPKKPKTVKPVSVLTDEEYAAYQARNNQLGPRATSTIGFQNDRLLTHGGEAGRALKATLRPETIAWFSDGFRTSKNFPYGNNGYIEPGALPELERIIALEKEAAARAAGTMIQNPFELWRSSANRTFSSYPGFQGSNRYALNEDVFDLQRLQLTPDVPASFPWSSSPEMAISQRPFDRSFILYSGDAITGATGGYLDKSKLRVPKFAMGGLIKGPGTGTSDSIRATLGYAGGGSIRVSNGEYVVNAKSVKDYGVKTMDAINNGTATVGTNSGGTVYNINMPITSNNADAEGVANEVMRKLKLEVSKNNKTNRVGL